MRITNVVPVIAVKDIAKTRTFYTEVLDFEVVHQSDWYLHMRSGGDEKVEIGFVASNHPMQPEVFHPVFNGKGAFYSLEVDDVDAALDHIKRLKVPLSLSRRQEPWGEDHFAITDPNGVVLNIGRTEAARRGAVDMREHMMMRDQ